MIGVQMPELTVRKVEKDTSVEGFCRELYEETFDRRMRVPYGDLWKVASKGSADYVAVFDNDIFLGFYYVFLQGDNAFIYYLAVCPEMRGRGYGTDIVDLIKDTYPEKRIVVCIEAPHVDDKLVSVRYRRLAFYSRNGFIDTLYKFESVGIMYEVLYWGKAFEPEDVQDILRAFRRQCGFRR